MGAITTEYTSTELLITVASHLLEDKKSVLVGTGLPILAALLAQRTHDAMRRRGQDADLRVAEAEFLRFP